MTYNLPGHRRVLSGDNGRARVLAHSSICSKPSSFQDFFAPEFDATFVDKTLAIEAFLRNGLSDHLILRPRRCGKSYTLSMIREFMEHQHLLPLNLKDITKTKFCGTLIAGDSYRYLVTQHFHEYPVLYIDLKDVQGDTYERMLKSFDRHILYQLFKRSDLFQIGILDSGWKEWYGRMMDNPASLREIAFRTLSEALNIAYNRRVVVLIDEYDSPMHCAIENGYASPASYFFAEVFGSLLKGNNAVCASMMVGICRTAKSGWLSQLNNIRVFPMDAKDDRYARYFLFTEEEVRLLCDAHKSKLDITALRTHYNSYKARGSSGPVSLFNPLSVAMALGENKIGDYWVDTGRNAPVMQRLWQASEKFRGDFDRLITQENIELDVDEQINFKTLDTITDEGLWGLLYYAGYLAVEEFKGPSLSGCVFRIPNGEVTSEWHRWLKAHLRPKVESSLLGMFQIIVEGDAGRFQQKFTSFLQEHLSLFCVPQHKEKVYQALSFVLFYCLFNSADRRYDVKMEQDDGHGRSDITAHPRIANCLLSFVFEIKQVPTHIQIRGKRTLKPIDRLKKELNCATDRALQQIEERQYRARAPAYTRMIHEYGLAFAGKFCIVAVRTLQRHSDNGDWVEMNGGPPMVPEDISETDLVGDESGDDNMHVDTQM